MRKSSHIARATAALGAIAAAMVVGPAGGNHYILCPDHCEALDTVIDSPVAATTDAAGNVYFSSRNVVFKLDGQGIVTRLAGDGTPGFSGDGGPAIDAHLYIPYFDYPEYAEDWLDYMELVGGLSVDAAGNVFVADVYNRRVRKIDPAGVITTVAGNGSPGYPASGPAGVASLGWPQGVAADAWGNVYISDGFVKRLGPDGELTPINCGQSSEPGACGAVALALDYFGNVYVADINCRVLKIGIDGSVVTVAGGNRAKPASFSPCGPTIDGQPAVMTALESPFGVAVGPAGDLYIADAYNNCVTKVDGVGIITTVAGLCRGGWVGYSGDGGLATDARLNRPHGVAVDAAGNVYIADTDNNRIRKVTPDGIITTVAGNGGAMPQSVRGDDVK
jgi:trimeric autotransporter adhesin